MTDPLPADREREIRSDPLAAVLTFREGRPHAARETPALLDDPVVSPGRPVHAAERGAGGGRGARVHALPRRWSNGVLLAGDRVPARRDGDGRARRANR